MLSFQAPITQTLRYMNTLSMIQIMLLILMKQEFCLPKRLDMFFLAVAFGNIKRDLFT